MNFDISKLLIQGNTDCCCEYIAGGVIMYLYGCIRLLVTVCAVCLCMCVRYQIRVLVKNHVSDLSKHDALLHKTQSKVLQGLWYQGLTCVDP